MSIGNAEVLALLDMVPPPYETGELFPDVPAEAWAPYAADHLENGKLQLYYGCFAVRSQGRVVLVDTGMGPGPHPTRGNRTGELANLLVLRGIALEDVDVVVQTHLHADHVGWNVTVEGGRPRPTFPKARYLVPLADWDHFTTASVLAEAPYVRDSVVPLEGLQVMDLIEGEHAITSEVSTLPTPGHTPGHLNVLISSEGQKGVIVGDLLHSRVQIQNPDWCARADLDKEMGRTSRVAMLERMELEGLIVAAGHFKPGEHFGRVVRRQGHRYWQVL